MNNGALQLVCLLWKSWKTTLRSIGWSVSQIVITILIWIGLYYSLTKGMTMLNDRTVEGEGRSAANLTSSSQQIGKIMNNENAYFPYRCVSEETCSIHERILEVLNSSLPEHRKECKKIIEGCEDSWQIQKWTDSVVDIVFGSTKPCALPSYSSDQFGNGNFPTCGENAFHSFAKVVGGISSMSFEYFYPINFQADHASITWTAIIAAVSLPVMIFCAQTAQEVSQESSSKIKDYLLSMGLGRIVYYFHHFIFNYFKALLPVTGVCIIIGVSFKSVRLTIYLLAIIPIALSSWISIALLIGSTFKKPGTATLLAFFTYFTMLWICLAYEVKRTEIGLSYVASLAPNYALLFSLDAKRESELRGKSLFFSEMGEVFPQGSAICMLIFDTVLYFFLAVFVDYMRSSFDNPLAILKRKTIKAEKEDQPLLDNHEKSEGNEGADIIVENVHKMYSTGEYAVRGLDMSFHKGQVSALLGHNGAGKSTTFSMISGMTVPSKGNIKILNCETQAEKNKAIGFCPQYNAIFPKLTVEEHLKFFARIKGCKTWKEDGERVLTTLGMMDKWKSRASALSGGMKRKLSIAIALAGNSPIVLLDEPTAGMDTAARRDFERLLMDWKKDHTIILTTHYTDEAELLADRIFIMAKGRVFCSGTPQFLRKRFDSGYVVSFALQKDTDGEKSMEEMTKIAKEFVTDVRPNKSRGLQFELKLVEDDTSKFANMFRKIEENCSSLGIESYGLSVTKLEQVFLKVGELTGTEDRKNEVNEALNNLIDQNVRRSGGVLKVINQFRYLLYKRFSYDKAHLVSLVINLMFIFVMNFLILQIKTGFTVFQKSNSISVDLLHTDKCYRIGLKSIDNRVKTIQSSEHLYGPCISFEILESETILKWYTRTGLDRPPILGAISQDSNDTWTTYVHPREERHRSILESIVARVNNEQLTEIEYGFVKENSARNSTTPESQNEMMNTSLILLLLVLSMPQIVYRPINFLIVEKMSKFGHQERLTGVNRVVLILSNVIYDFVLFLLHFSVLLLAILIADKVFFKAMINEFILYMFVGFISAELIILIVYRVFSSPAKGENLFLFLSFLVNIISVVIMLLYLCKGYKAPSLLLTPAIALWSSFTDFFRLSGVCLLEDIRAENNDDYETLDKRNDIPQSRHSSHFNDYETFPRRNDNSESRQRFHFNALEGTEDTTFATTTTVPFTTTTTSVYNRPLIPSIPIDPEPSHPTTPQYYAIAHFITLIFVLLILEFMHLLIRIVMKPKSSTGEIATENSDTVLNVNCLEKWHGRGRRRVHAVKGVSFNVPAHECFGVLGVNGAGKTSMFEVLTGNCYPNKGSATVNGVDCRTPATIGYCPQFDAMIEDLTGRQCLVILAALHGYKNPQMVADIVITCVGMEKHAKKKTKKYSGGQRRKISVAASLLAQESLIILDEPTAGIDPIARRDIWSVICALRESTNTAIVITSHSMDEVEALVSNLIIMKAGVIAVQGTPQSIKSQYCEYYNFNLTVNYEKQIEEVSQSVLRTFPTATLYDSASMKNIEYRIPRSKTDIFSGLFEKAAAVSSELKASDFVFTQATLEDAFIFIANTQMDKKVEGGMESQTAVTAMTQTTDTTGTIGVEQKKTENREESEDKLSAATN